MLVKISNKVTYRLDCVSFITISVGLQHGLQAFLLSKRGMDESLFNFDLTSKVYASMEPVSA